MEAIPVGLFNGLGVVTVVLLMGWSVITGRLVPRKTHQDALDALAKKDEQIAEQALQIRQLSEVGLAMNAVLRAVQQGATSDHEVPG